MHCKPCALADAIVGNVALWADLTLNLILGGNVRETVSKRASRARTAGSKPAKYFCAVLTFIGNVVFRMHRDHCTWAESGQTIASEIWHWSTPDTSDVGNG